MLQSKRVLSKSILIMAFLITALHADSLKDVKLKLKWHHQFQFAGYYAAKELGYYKDAGLDVQILERGGDDPYKAITDGRAEFGVYSSDLVMKYANHKNTVALMAIYQHSPFAIVTKKGVKNIKELKHKKLMLESGANELSAYLKRNGVTPKNVKLVEHSFKIDDFADGEVDAISAYISSEPYYLDKKNIEYKLLKPISSGIDFYGDILFTSKSYANKNPKTVEAFVEASKRGWKYAIENPDRVIDMILDKYNTQGKSREYYKYEAKHSLPLIKSSFVEVGYIHKDRIEHIAKIYQEIGKIKGELPEFESFIYKQEKDDYFLRALIIFFFVVILILILGFVIIKLKKALKKEIERRTKQEQLLIEQSRLATMGEMMDGIAHQWMQPLSGISMSSAFILDECSASNVDDARKDSVSFYCEKIDTQVKFLRETMQNFRNFLKPNTKKEKLSVEKEIDEVVGLLRYQLDKKGIAFKLEATSDLIISGSSNEFKNAVLNIIVNAIDELSRNKIEKPYIVVEIESGKLYIQDNAGGIKVEPIEDVFKYRYSTKKDGSGIGLYIAKTIIEEHFGGKLTVSNNSKGAVFVFDFPH